MAYGDRREWGGGVMMCPRGKLRLSFRIGVRKASGAWTVRVCERCEEPRRMPESEIVCRRCEPNGSPKSWRLVGLREARLKAGMPCEELARRAGVKPVTLEKAEKLVQVLVFGCAYWRIADDSCSATPTSGSRSTLILMFFQTCRTRRWRRWRTSSPTERANQ